MRREVLEATIRGFAGTATLVRARGVHKVAPTGFEPALPP
jgi:hypothetical protein